MKKRKVLIPLDGSAFSRRIIPAVREHYKPAETDLVLLRVALPAVLPPEATPATFASSLSPGTEVGGSHEPPRPARSSLIWSPEEEASYRAKLRAELQPEADELEELGYGVTVEVLFGEAAPRIIEYVKSTGIDLIAMTTHGRTGIGRLVLGSVAQSVLRAVEIPVLLLRTATPIDE